MDFASMRAYLDASNWQQTPPLQPQQNQHGSIILNPNNPNPLLPPPPLPPPSHPPPHTGQMGLGGSIRPGSMAERARMANIPMPVTAIKCPRCNSTNTKFCYYNNYSLSQPRHFCKACRRYWTNGGNLRNVPVGGGCRRNKRSKSSSSAASSSKSAGNNRSTSAAAATTSSANSAPPSSVADILGLTPPPLRFMSPLHHQLSDFISGGDLGLSSYSGVSGTGEAGFHLGSAAGAAPEQWRAPPPQFPFLGGLDAAAGASLYGHSFELPSLGIGQLRPKPLDVAAAGHDVAAPPVKAEDNARNMSLMRQFSLGNGGAGEQYNWGGGGGGSNGWSDISGLNNSSCSNTSGM